MKRLLIAGALVLALTGCDVASQIGAVPASPSAVADRTTLDEQAGITVTLAYTAASKAAALAIRTGLVKDPRTIRHIGALDRVAYDAVGTVRAAYQTGNAASYAAAVLSAQAAIAQLVSASKGL